MTLNNQKLQLCMAEKILTVTQLANKSGLSRIFIGNCVNGRTNPKPATIGILAKSLGVPVSAIIDMETPTFQTIRK